MIIVDWPLRVFSLLCATQMMGQSANVITTHITTSQARGTVTSCNFMATAATACRASAQVPASSSRHVQRNLCQRLLWQGPAVQCWQQPAAHLPPVDERTTHRRWRPATQIAATRCSTTPQHTQLVLLRDKYTAPHLPPVDERGQELIAAHVAVVVHVHLLHQLPHLQAQDNKQQEAAAATTYEVRTAQDQPSAPSVGALAASDGASRTWSAKYITKTINLAIVQLRMTRPQRAL